MKNKLILSLICLFLFQANVFSQSNTLQLRLERAVKIAFQSDEVTLHKLDLKKDKLPAELSKSLKNDMVYMVDEEECLKGYAYVGFAPSKEREFDYVLIFNPDHTIKQAKVLIYRETFGREIDSPRWLDQFIGMSPKSTFKFGEDIDAISGATISARSMTRAVQNALINMGALVKNNLL